MTDVACRHCGKEVEMLPGEQDKECPNCHNYVNTIPCPECGQPVLAKE